MNINEKNIYEKFIDINLKHRWLIIKFIEKNCPVSSKKKNNILYEKLKDFKPKDLDDLKKKKKKILENIKLSDFNKISIFEECNSCDLCEYKSFCRIKKDLYEMLDNILMGKLQAERTINDFIKKIGNINFKVIEDSRGKFRLQKGETLRQIIYFDFIQNIVERLNEYFGKQNMYYKQIARLLLVNSDFLERLEIIRSEYFRPREIEGYTIYHPDKKFSKNFSGFQKKIFELRKEFNITQRWEPYIIQGMLIYPINDYGELVVPEDRPVPRPTDGTPGRLLSIVDGKKLPIKPIIVGDESEDMISAYVRKYGIEIKKYKRTGRYRQPLKNFNRDFRWYRKYQRKIKIKGIKTKGSIFSEIFFDDVKNHPEDWEEHDYIDYLKESNKMTDISKEDIEIKGSNRIRAVIYRLDNIVYRQEK